MKVQDLEANVTRPSSLEQNLKKKTFITLIKMYYSNTVL